MKKLVLMLFVSGSFCSFGQSVSPDVIATSGGHFQNASSQLSWTLGEPITETISDGSNQLTQGFHQTNLSWVSVFELDETTVFNVYPNPVVDELRFEVSMLELGSFIKLIDSRGRVILEQPVNNLATIVDFSALSKGSYHLSMYSSNQKLIKTFTIQKAN